MYPWSKSTVRGYNKIIMSIISQKSFMNFRKNVLYSKSLSMFVSWKISFRDFRKSSMKSSTSRSEHSLRIITSLNLLRRSLIGPSQCRSIFRWLTSRVSRLNARPAQTTIRVKLDRKTNFAQREKHRYSNREKSKENEWIIKEIVIIVKNRAKGTKQTKK